MKVMEKCAYCGIESEKKIAIAYDRFLYLCNYHFQLYKENQENMKQKMLSVTHF